MINRTTFMVAPALLVGVFGGIETVAAGGVEIRIMAKDDVNIARKSSAALGEEFHGGICAEAGGCDDDGGDLILALDEDGYYYGGFYGTKGYVTGATSSTDGYSNTKKAAQAAEDGKGSINPTSWEPNAPIKCWDKTTNGFDDWYLPAIDELETVYANLKGVVAFHDDYYWSSTENTADTAYRLFFRDGFIGPHGKGEAQSVRCVRRVN